MALLIGMAEMMDRLPTEEVKWSLVWWQSMLFRQGWLLPLVDDLSSSLLHNSRHSC